MSAIQVFQTDWTSASSVRRSGSGTVVLPIQQSSTWAWRERLALEYEGWGSFTHGVLVVVVVDGAVAVKVLLRVEGD